MGVGIDEDLGVSSEAAEDTQRLLYTPSFLAPCIELAIGEGSCPALAVAVVALGVDHPSLGKGC